MQDYHRVSYRVPLVLMMGSERQGLSEERQTACDLLVSIPMAGRSDSLNLAVATAVVLHEIFNQRRDGRVQIVQGGSSGGAESSPR